MVSQRQRLARKRLKETNPDLFPAAEEDSTGEKKKKNKGFISPLKPRKPPSLKKHPLRVAGMKPGDSCFICKSLDHIAKNCPKKAEWERNKICLSCRRRGHSLKNCPNTTAETAEKKKKLCYNCGETGHSLSACPLPRQDGGTTYASCFVCNQTGHLSKDCPKNRHGIYPKGGCCKICGGVTHLARDCPNKDTKPFSGNNELLRRPNRITRFGGGDDLEDDFTATPVVASFSKEAAAAGTKRKSVITNVVTF
ncbi:hypothetical protein M569_10557 [Genlisea aurea]|uniref:CCHC-type domain-containing protein n=1 Tax=Genlisea aurea TaxID=192259 RepID=S8CBI2_9LAMI|nr:hypothetical protein M569_10557 [Genlisea aurea]